MRCPYGCDAESVKSTNEIWVRIDVFHVMNSWNKTKQFDEYECVNCKQRFYIFKENPFQENNV